MRSLDYDIPILSTDFREARSRVLNFFELKFLAQMLTEHRGNITAAALATGMTRQNFQRLVKKHGLKVNNFR